MPSRLRQLIIYVSGASGSGKTTLAKILDEQFFLPHVSSDLTLSGLRRTLGTDVDRKNIFMSTFIPLMMQMAKDGISFVADSVLYKDTSANDIIARITPLALVVNVHLQAVNSIERFYTRESTTTDRGNFQTPEQIAARAAFHQNNFENTADPLQLAIPQITVNTTDGYNPRLPAIMV